MLATVQICQNLLLKLFPAWLLSSQRFHLEILLQIWPRSHHSITVRVAFGKGNGSGILLQRDGAVYTVLTAAHVVGGETAGKLTIMNADDKEYVTARIFGFPFSHELRSRILLLGYRE
jgi:hypothetical protein